MSDFSRTLIEAVKGAAKHTHACVCTVCMDGWMKQSAGHSLHCIPSYRTYRRPSYKVAYKMVTEMEWRCCHGYSGEDCHDGPRGGTDTQVNTGRPRITQTGHNTGGGQRGGDSNGMRAGWNAIYSHMSRHHLEALNLPCEASTSSKKHSI